MISIARVSSNAEKYVPSRSLARNVTRVAADCIEACSWSGITEAEETEEEVLMSVNLKISILKNKT